MRCPEGCCDWTVEVVDTFDDSGEHSAITLDGEGNPIIAYQRVVEDDFYNTRDSDPVVARMGDDGAWELSPLEVPGQAQLVTDKTGVVHAFTVEWDMWHTYASVNYGQVGTDIAKERVATESHCNVDMALAPSGTPHVVYCTADYELMHAWREDGEWKTEVVAAASEEEKYFGVAIAAGPADVLDVVWKSARRSSSYGIYPHRAHKGGEAWEIADDPPRYSDEYAKRLVADDAGDLHFAFFATGWDDREHLFYARLHDAVWSEIEEVLPDLAGTGAVELVIGPSGRPHLLWERSSAGLFYATRELDAWRVSRIEPESKMGTGAGLAVDEWGSPHVSYQDQGLGELRYARVGGPPAPELPLPALNAAAAIYDPDGDRIVLAGGGLYSDGKCGYVALLWDSGAGNADTWIMGLDDHRWRRLPTRTRPRERPLFAYDGKRRRLVVTGGRPSSSGGIWRVSELLDLATDDWTEVMEGQLGVAGAMVYDEAGDRFLAFGGSTSTSFLGISPGSVNAETHALGAETLTPSLLVAEGAGPSPRAQPAHLWDPGRRRLVIYGGTDTHEYLKSTHLDDLWALDLSGETPTWGRLDDAATQRPAGRSWASMIYDEPRDRYLLFGGREKTDMGYVNSLWAFDPVAGDWSLLRGGDAAHTPLAPVVRVPEERTCDFPADLTTVAPDSPERRGAAAFVVTPRGAYLIGGRTDCGNIDDVWRLDLETDTWTEIRPATTGLTCLRAGGTSCAGLCE